MSVLRSESSKILPEQGAALVVDFEGYKGFSGIISKHYASSLVSDEVLAHYKVELESSGWRFLNTTYADGYVFCKERLHATLFFKPRSEIYYFSVFFNPKTIAGCVNNK
ncbi:hypothetical protein PS3A_38190 [Pseudomonas sp. 3A(2025)]